MINLTAKQLRKMPQPHGNRLVLDRKHEHSALLKRNGKGDYFVTGVCSYHPSTEQKSGEIGLLAISQSETMSVCGTILMDPAR